MEHAWGSDALMRCSRRRGDDLTSGADTLQTSGGPSPMHLVQLCPREGSRRLGLIAAGALDSLVLRTLLAAAAHSRTLRLHLCSRDAAPAAPDPIPVTPALVEPAHQRGLRAGWAAQREWLRYFGGLTFVH